MKTVIDHLTSTSGWVVNSPTTIATQAYSDFIAGLNSTSLIINFNAIDAVRTAVKTYGTPFDVSDKQTLVLSVWSRDFGSQSYNKAGDFSYKIKLNGTDEFYLPVYENFTDVNIGIENVTSISRIEITALHSLADSLIISEMIAEKETLPLDILNDTQEAIEYYRDAEYTDGVSVGTVTSATAADTSITFAAVPDFVERYSVVKIKDNSNEEIIQLGDNDGTTYQLISYLGAAGALVNSYTNATVYIQFPVYRNPNQIDVRLPGIAIWGIEPEVIIRANKLDVFTEAFSVPDDNFEQRQDGEILVYTILIDCESNSPELIDKMTRIVRRFIGSESLWVNGRLHEIEPAGPAVEQRPEVGFDIVHKVQYSFTVEAKESIYDRVTVEKVTTQNITVDTVEG